MRPTALVDGFWRGDQHLRMRRRVTDKDRLGCLDYTDGESRAIRGDAGGFDAVGLDLPVDFHGAVRCVDSMQLVVIVQHDVAVVAGEDVDATIDWP